MCCNLKYEVTRRKTITATLTENEWDRAKVAALVVGESVGDFYVRSVVSSTESILRSRKNMKPVCNDAYGADSFDSLMDELEEPMRCWGDK